MEESSQQKVETVEILQKTEEVRKIERRDGILRRLSRLGPPLQNSSILSIYSLQIVIIVADESSNIY